MRTIVISAVNLRKGGTLAILRDCLSALSEMAVQGEVRVIALVHRKDLAEYPGIEYIELPWSVRSWIHRIWCEYVTMYGVSKRIGDIDLWLSLHDTTPRVKARRQAVYCHNSYPFFRWHWRHLWQNYRIVCFALFTRWIYRINLYSNDFVIVQSQWFREAFAQMFNLDKCRIVVFPPGSDKDENAHTKRTFIQHSSIDHEQDSDSSQDHHSSSVIRHSSSVTCHSSFVTRHSSFVTFLYPAYPDVHKNFECVCEAARLLEQEVGEGRFEVLLTTDGTFNRYSRWLHRHWGDVCSIRFCGFVSKERLDELYAQTDCLLFPSMVETWGLPISEFAVTGRPMILADLPYAHETAAGSRRTAFFNPDDPIGLKELMRDVLGGETEKFKGVTKTLISPPLVRDWKQIIEGTFSHE